METFATLLERFLVFVYHCFDRCSSDSDRMATTGPVSTST
jgi:hypothetical protein